MFIGSINRYMRAVLETAAEGWRGRPVYVACSGNFTVERILARRGAHASRRGAASQSFIGAVHSNDVWISGPDEPVSFLMNLSAAPVDINSGSIALRLAMQ
jgi:hypothetical protein